MNNTAPSLFHGGLPRIVSGVEHEYKWLVTDRDVPGFVDSPDAVLMAVGAPDGFRGTLTAASTQSCLYLDTSHSTLARAGISLTVLVNYGPRRQIRWLTAKETLLWAEGRRDTLEISERIDHTAMSDVLSRWTAQPLVWLNRRFGERLDLRAFGATTQRRRQALLTSDDGCSLGLSLDETTTRDANGTERAVDRWLEVETNQSDFRALSGLATWAQVISDRLGLDPYEKSKPIRTAEILGQSRVD